MTLRVRSLVLALAGLAAWFPVALAQAPPSNDAATRGASPRSPDSVTDDQDDGDEPAEKPAKPADDTARRGIFGDTKRFTAVSGWGSIGSGMGRFGFAKSTLILLPAVQEELKITDEQRVRLNEWLSQMRDRGEEFGKSMRSQNGEADPLRSPDAPIEARMERFNSVLDQVGRLVAENETGVNAILKPDQRKRLNQIALQMEGIAALARPEVAQAVNLSPSQSISVQQILAGASAMQMTTWMTQSMAMMNQRRGPNAARKGEASATRPSAKRATSGTAKKTPSKGDDDRGDPNSPRDEVADRAAREKAMRAQFEAIRDRTDQIHEQAVQKITRLLTQRQRATFVKMLGEPFDPAAVAVFPRSAPQRGSDNTNDRERSG
jgi:hypothetical protein